MKTTDLSHVKIAARPLLEGKLVIPFPFVVLVPANRSHLQNGSPSRHHRHSSSVYADLSPAMFSYVTIVAVIPFHLLSIFQAIQPYLTMLKEICLPILLELKPMRPHHPVKGRVSLEDIERQKAKELLLNLILF